MPYVNSKLCKALKNKNAIMYVHFALYNIKIRNEILYTYLYIIFLIILNYHLLIYDYIHKSQDL